MILLISVLFWLPGEVFLGLPGKGLLLLFVLGLSMLLPVPVLTPLLFLEVVAVLAIFIFFGLLKFGASHLILTAFHQLLKAVHTLLSQLVNLLLLFEHFLRILLPTSRPVASSFLLLLRCRGAKQRRLGVELWFQILLTLDDLGIVLANENTGRLLLGH